MGLFIQEVILSNKFMQYMNIEQRKELLARLGEYMLSDDGRWEEARNRAFGDNNWFTREFVDLAVKNIALNFLQPAQIQQLIDACKIPFENSHPKKVGIVMAGNIPLVGFHDLLCVFISGHQALVKPSSKDETLVKHLVAKMSEWNPGVEGLISFNAMLKNCDAYIATGSNNSSRYFDYYFQKYPHIIRRNRTSVAVLTGKESKEELESLADDVYQYFGLGCRNVTKLFVPREYDFIPLLEAFKKYDHLADHQKYKNNYDYNLAIQILNNHYYMTNGSILLVEREEAFSPISQLNYQYYTDLEEVEKNLTESDAVQCIVGANHTGFGKAQLPQICEYADGVDTMEFLMGLYQTG
jgi:hypothetical protein